MENKFDISVRTYKIIPPIGKTFGFGAKARIYKKENLSEKVIYETGEVWGRTENEAEDKANKTAKKWIEEHSS